MPNLKIVRLVQQLRNKDECDVKIYDLFLAHTDLFQEVEFYTDFEDLMSEIRMSISRTMLNREGFIYAAANDIDDAVKVGRTIDVASRSRSLNGAGVLNELEIQQSWQVYDAVWFETKIHQALKNKRPNKKEFFMGRREDIISDVNALVSHLEEDYRKKLIEIGLQDRVASGTIGSLESTKIEHLVIQVGADVAQ
jgi:hypothetical protein